MPDNQNGLSNDELWLKCQQEKPITSQDLGINSIQNSSTGTIHIKDGMNPYLFNLHHENKK